MLESKVRQRGVRCLECRKALSWLPGHGYLHSTKPKFDHKIRIDIRTIPRGHDTTPGMVIRYTVSSIPAGPNRYMMCHDCGRPIPPGVRCWRRIDARQLLPTICDPCHEEIERLAYKNVKVQCLCGEMLRWESGSWTHDSDGMVTRLATKVCPNCNGADGGCRVCLRTGRVQYDEHQATPRPGQEVNYGESGTPSDERSDSDSA